ncbi:hypothetical protein OG689_42545 [Kitasatospora sp. NBC_00240]|uniref:hypothetical protein n=1 Tax=Kitasatospora sp. NBC_00240 TaxID=2903567 RepID=UPI00224E20AB|nr:hypothetical protein [Kitasatospora sp. NBC_00240]MCX5215832.1 hypothetical protein [Kitasatospora sp. NBC_00240]
MSVGPELETALRGIAEAVQYRDDHVLRRLLARLAEQATIDDLYALRDALPRLRTSASTTH